MKKNFLIKFILIALVCTGITVCANEAAFVKALRTCTPFRDTGTVTVEGMNIQSVKEISGFQDDKCRYTEKINMAGINSVIACRFTRPQINELASVIEAYELVQQYSGETPDLSSLDGAQNNPVAKAWTKYIQNSSICTITTEQAEPQ